MKKNFKVILVAVLMAVAFIAGWGSSFITPSEAKVDLKYGGQYYPGEFLLYGHPEFWSQYDLTVEHTLFSSGAENNEALISGKININCGSDSKTIAIFNAIPEQALIIGTVQRGNRYTTIVRKDSEYQTWDDLVGKTVGTRFGTGAEGVLRRYFDQTEYDWDDFDWKNVKVENMISALDAGQIEAFTAWAPTPAIAEAQGVGRALMSYGEVAMVPASIHTTKQFAYQHPALVVSFLAAQLDKAEMIKNNPVEAAQIASDAAAEKGIDVSADAFEKVYGRIDFQIEFNQTIIDEIYATAEFLKQEGKIDEVPTLAWDTSFLEAAKELQEIQE